jgi:hypothetical protein
VRNLFLLGIARKVYALGFGRSVCSPGGFFSSFALFVLLTGNDHAPGLASRKYICR